MQYLWHDEPIPAVAAYVLQWTKIENLRWYQYIIIVQSNTLHGINAGDFGATVAADGVHHCYADSLILKNNWAWVSQLPAS